MGERRCARVSNVVRIRQDLNLGDLVLTPRGSLAQVREIERTVVSRPGLADQGEVKTEVRLNTGEWVYTDEVALVPWLGWRAQEEMKRRGRSAL